MDDGRIATLTGLFEAHAESVFNVAYRITWNRSDAEDVLQSAFLQAFIHLDDLRNGDRARPWLLRICYHQALTVLRRRRDVPTDPDRLPLQRDSRFNPAGDDPSDTIIARDLAETIKSAIAALPENLRLAIVLRDVEGLPMSDVAEILGIGASAAKMRVARGRESLRTTLEGAF